MTSGPLTKPIDTLTYSGSPQLSSSSSSAYALHEGMEYDFSFSPSLSLSQALFLETPQMATSWFASPETWQIVYFPKSRLAPIEPNGLRRYISTVRRWFDQWLETGNNAFIHPQLYRNRLPAGVQDAYSTLSCYKHKTAYNERIVFQMIEDRAKRLVEKESRRDPSTLDAFDHLSRVHSMMVYQLLGLYDGDIRLRHITEKHMPLYLTWMQEMLKYASQTVYWLGDSIIPARNEEGCRTSGGAVDQVDENSRTQVVLWYSWIVAESIRRTYIVGCSIYTIFNAMQQALGDACGGSLMFTTRRGAWEAQSASAWEKLCLEVNLGFMQFAEVDKLIGLSKVEDVNDFARAVLDALFGQEQLEEWATSVVV